MNNRIHKLRIENNLTGKQLADLVGVSEDTIWGWEAGRSKPRLFYIPALAKALNTTQDYLLYGEALSLNNRIKGKIVDNIIIAPHSDAFYLQINFVDKSSVKITDKVLFAHNIHDTFKEVMI